jgi:uncharacterized membrane protein
VTTLDRLHGFVHLLLDRRLAVTTREERAALLEAAKALSVARDVTEAYEADLTFGERLADKVASFGGSWTFIMLFGGFLAVWVAVNSVQFLSSRPIDPYPFIFLNLMLSMIAAVQAPIIMMSQNRQTARDRLAATNDYDVNIKAEIEIMALHEKLDRLRTNDLYAIIKAQGEEIAAIRRLVEARGLGPSPEQ